ncbi:signal peptide, CUB and EGF-like domain-containing protein 1 isoform X2 [Mya arenaria]|uniref:signal peptide, CUB and EGF-like domain-containing protein 1 isoform X2 n=1 Tax=Mya arenaria TaxID=6604 RepID=UPI0022DFBAE4|nr:signal peptide, CUB and EGF-like domain-containing protein 1 isoform X2 [Mya arenaria]
MRIDYVTLFHVCTFVALFLPGTMNDYTGNRHTRGVKGNECEKGTLTCHKDATCIDAVRTSRCRCQDGFYGDGHIKCYDINECQNNNGGCVHFCENTQGNYTCRCREGFQVDRDRKDCIDLNECFEEKGGCQHQCVNTMGGYECRCNQGYSLESNGKSCKLGTYCQRRQGCEHSCTTTQQGSVVCTCRHGYNLHSNGKNCVQTCMVGNGGCQHNCTDAGSGVRCSCANHYLLTSDNHTCIATCMVNNGGCERKCKDTPSGPICSCPDGFELHQDGKSCLDIDECASENGGCSHECVNLEGGYECVCPPGYKVQPHDKTCKDIDECDARGTCDHLCLNTPGSYLCACNDGYERYGISHCADKDECSDNNGGCAHSCVNTNGSHICSCNEGYTLFSNSRDCVPDNKCYMIQEPPGGSITCKDRGKSLVCTYKCSRKGRFVSDTNFTEITTFCGPETKYKWDHETKNTTLPPCSSKLQSPNVGKTVVFQFPSKRCKRRNKVKMKLSETLTEILNGDKRYKCDGKCRVSEMPVLKCRRLRATTRPYSPYVVTVGFDISFRGRAKLKKNCDVKCVMKKTERKLKRVIKKLRRVIKKDEFKLTYSGSEYTALKKKFKSPRGSTLSCEPNSILFADTCVGCALGHYYDRKMRKCAPCRPGFYQDEEGMYACKPCSQDPQNAGIHAAVSEEQCTVQCEPGQYSESGFKPCKPCPVGTYQPGYGRLTCQACDGGIDTKGPGAVTFESCLAKEICRPGHYFRSSRDSCVSCERGFYQPNSGQNYCIRCPGRTTTDTDAATDVAQCKSHECGAVFSKDGFEGVIESPNYPGDYPTNVTCVWKIRPAKDRRILVIIPQVSLPKADKCGDKLVMRKSKNEFSTVSWETCETDQRPIAFTARSKRLWVQFTSDGQNTARGFSIPFVTYNYDYERLIESIVQDGRLYESFQHQSVLKDRKLLTELMRVIAKPEKYFQYDRNMTESLLPRSFIKLLRRKVIRFFSP